jgi:hypothetical protein
VAKTNPPPTALSVKPIEHLLVMVALAVLHILSARYRHFIKSDTHFVEKTQDLPAP